MYDVAIDYADQRFYASSYGRFNTADPYVAGGATKGSASNPGDPGSWNRYAYVEGDPVNKVDPSGLFGQDPCVIWGSTSWMCEPFSGLSGDPSSFPLTCLANPSGCVEQLGVELGGTGGGASLPFPKCNPGNSTQVANNLDFISTNYAAAQQISQQSGVPTDWLLGWTALESSATSPAGNLYGAITQAENGDNNFLGQTMGSPWVGQTTCPVTVTTNGGASTFACFASFAADLTAALTSYGSKYGNILSAGASGGQTALQAFTSLYVKWGQTPALAAGTAGLIQSQITNHIDAMLNCLQQNGYLNSQTP